MIAIMTRRRFKPRPLNKSVRREAEPNQMLAPKARMARLLRRTRRPRQSPRKLLQSPATTLQMTLRKILKRKPSQPRELLQRRFQPRSKPNQAPTLTTHLMMSQRRRPQLPRLLPKRNPLLKSKKAIQIVMNHPMMNQRRRLLPLKLHLPRKQLPKRNQAMKKAMIAMLRY